MNLKASTLFFISTVFLAFFSLSNFSSAHNLSVPSHIETWAYDDYHQGNTSKASLVREWVSYAESEGGQKAISDCHSRGRSYCTTLYYFDPNRIYSCQGCSIPIAKESKENWWLHQIGYSDSAHRLSATYNGHDWANLLNQNNPEVRNWLATYAQENLDGWDGLMVDDTSSGIKNEVWGSGAQTSEELRSDAEVIAMHKKLASDLKHRNGKPFLQISNTFSPNPFLPHGFELLQNPASEEGLVSEGNPISGGKLTIFYSTLLDSMAYIVKKTQGSLVLLSDGVGGNKRLRRLHEATVLLGYAPGRIVSWEDLAHGTTHLEVWPEEGLYPTKPLKTMTTPTGISCFKGDGSVCSQGGHSDLEILSQVYMREFGACYNHGHWVGPCAVIVNDSSISAPIQSRWLHQIYHHQITFSGGTIEEGGKLVPQKFSPGQRLASEDAIILVR